MSDMNRYSTEMWDDFFAFLVPSDEGVSREEVQDDLRRLGIDLGRSLSRVRDALECKNARRALDEARLRRHSVVERLKSIQAAPDNQLRERIQAMLGGWSDKPQSAVLFRKLEKASTEQDLRSLYDDLCRLKSLSEDTDGAGQTGE